MTGCCCCCCQTKSTTTTSNGWWCHLLRIIIPRRDGGVSQHCWEQRLRVTYGRPGEPCCTLWCTQIQIQDYTNTEIHKYELLRIHLAAAKAQFVFTYFIKSLFSLSLKQTCLLHCIGTTMCLKCGHRWWCKERLFTMETWLRHPDWQGHWPLSGETYVLFATNSAITDNEKQFFLNTNKISQMWPTCSQKGGPVENYFQIFWTGLPKKGAIFCATYSSYSNDP